MAEVQEIDPVYRRIAETFLDEIAASEGSTLAGAARTDDPPAVPMSGGEEPAGAAKHHD